MAWLSSASCDIIESKKYINEIYWIVSIGGTKKYSRTRTITVHRFPGLTQAVAEAKAVSAAALTDNTDAHTEATGGGSYACLSTFEVFGAYVIT